MTRHDADSLWLLAPGLLHQLANAMFTVQGHAQVLGNGSTDPAHRRTILAAAERAGGALQILRWLLGDEHGAELQVGVLLQRLLEPLNVSLREAGLRLELLHSSRESPLCVAAGRFSRTLLALLRQLIAVSPPGSGSTLLLDLCEQTTATAVLRAEIKPPRSALPFPIDLRAASGALATELGDDATVSVDPTGNCLLLVFRRIAAATLAETLRPS